MLRLDSPPKPPDVDAEGRGLSLCADRRGLDALRGGDNGKAIIPGKSSESLLIKNVSGENADTVMPPKGERLTAKQIAMLRQWIDAGAAWPDGPAIARNPKDHWAFKLPSRSAIVPPMVSGGS